MSKSMALVFVTAAIVPLMAVAEQKLSRDEVVEVFTDVTFDGIYHPRNSRFSAYDAPDGTLIVVQSNGSRSGDRAWFVNDKGQRCATDPKWKNKPEWRDGRCFEVIDGGDGKYLQYENGKHTHTFSNFRKGNQL